MIHPTLIIITGHPGAGKTTIAGQLSRHYMIPYCSKDTIKEHIFDTLGSSDKVWSLRVSAAAHRLMDEIVEQELSTGHSLILESNFKTGLDSIRFSEAVTRHNAQCVQILCVASGDVLFDRWNHRIAHGIRHEGHAEESSLDQIRQDLAQPYEPLRLPGRLITIDTTDPGQIVLPEL